MRADTVTFHNANVAPQKSPRFVVAIIFDVASFYITSHTGITTVPGTVFDGALKATSAFSQKIVPDEGRTEIGAMSFEVVDLSSAFTLATRSKLGGGDGLRGKEVRLYVGYEGMDFTAFQRFQTQVVSDVEFDDGVYRIQCRDITREQRKEIFEPKKTTLRDSITATSTTIPVYVTTGFSTVFHGPSYSDGPSSTVGYIKVDDEIIRYTGKTADTFTGCTRGVLNTQAVAHEVDASTDADRRPKVEEYIYLELPAAKLIYAILTGTLYNDSASLPSHWHLGIASTWVRLSDFTGLGSDLWDPALDTAGFVTRFAGLTKTDGKKFLESELYQLLGCFPVIYSDGTIGIKKMNHVLADAPYVVELNEKNTVSWSALKHEMNGLFNEIRVNWNYNDKDFTREKLVVDAASVALNTGQIIKELSFKGLHGSRHTDAIVAKRIDALRDRYTYAPETMEVTVLPSLNRLEVGDIVRVKLQNVRDFAGSGSYIDRSFEIQQKVEDFATGQVTLSLFGSTGRASVDAPTTDASPLPDAYYTAVGVNLNTVCTISVVGGVGIIQPGTYNLTGNANMNASSAVYYYPGDLELADGAILQVNNNVQIRVRGFWTINGDITGLGRGKTGVADSAGYDTIQAGAPGFIGNSRGMDGAIIRQSGRSINISTVPCAITQGQYSAFPYLDLVVSGTSLTGIPSDLRGTSGGGGGKIQSSQIDGSTPSVRSVGGTGGNSGAGLSIICRGLAFGASGSINLSGASSAATSLASPLAWYPGSGGAGSPGGLLVLLDGSGISLPDLGGKFVAACGSVPINGTPLPVRGPVGPTELIQQGWTSPGAGYLDEAYISALDLSNSAHRIQYVPETQTPAEDEDTLPAAPTSLVVSPGQLENVLTIGLPAVGSFDVIEIYAAVLNDRTGATLVDSVGGSVYHHQLTGGVTRYYWVRSRRGAVTSAWFPSSSTGGISGTVFARFVARGNCQIIEDVARKVGGSVAWDSDVYSPDQYLNGCFVTWRADQANASVMVGLNSDPTTDQNYTGIDYTWLARSDGICEIYESGVSISTHGSYTTSTIFEVRYDGKLIKYFKGGALVRQVPVQNLTLFMDSSFADPGARISALQFGPLNAVTPSPWVARGNCIAGVTTARKAGGTNAWDSDIYSIDSYSACHVKFKCNQTNLAVIIGLNTDPITNQSFASIDYALYAADDGLVYIFENGTQIGSNRGAYTTLTEFAITFDGNWIRYYKDRVELRSVSISGLTLFADASFFNVGAAVNSLHFGPGTALEALGTPDIEPNAATAVNVTVEPADGSQAYSVATQPVFEVNGLNGTASYTSPVHTATQVNVAWSGQARISNTTSGVAVGEAWIQVRVFINGSEVWNQHQILEGYTAAGDWASFSGSRDFAVPAGQTIDAYLQTTRNFSSGGSSPAQTMYWREALLNLVGQLR
jgi:hypothetical protein